jgi:hypothetical protein
MKGTSCVAIFLLLSMETTKWQAGKHHSVSVNWFTCCVITLSIQGNCGSRVVQGQKATLCNSSPAWKRILLSDRRDSQSPLSNTGVIGSNFTRDLCLFCFTAVLFVGSEQWTCRIFYMMFRTYLPQITGSWCLVSCDSGSNCSEFPAFWSSANNNNNNNNNGSLALVCKRTISTERPPLVGEVNQLLRIEVVTWSARRISTAVFSAF